jgi:GntR family transcriptional repressor for pyruvate dehydrogenase complex
VARSILEARLHIGPRVAALAAERAGAALGPQLQATVLALAAEPDPVAQQQIALTFWDHVVDGADSIAFRLMFNSLRAAYEPALTALASVMADEVGRPEAYEALTEAIVAADPERAHHAAEALLRPATNTFLEAIRTLEES